MLPSAGLAAGLALLAACQDLGPEHASVTVRYLEVPPLDRGRLVVTLADPARQWYLEGIDLMTSADDGWLVSRELRTAASGRLTVRLAVRGPGTAPVAAGDAVLPLAAGSRWRVDIFPSELTPAAVCDDCAGVRRIPLSVESRPSAQDWLYLTWTAVGPPAG